MTNTSKLTGAALAILAAGALMNVGTAPAHAAEGKMVHCEGVNACKGHNDCKTATNACKGQASCKGTGFVALTSEQCEKVGGKAGK